MLIQITNSLSHAVVNPPHFPRCKELGHGLSQRPPLWFFHQEEILVADDVVVAGRHEPVVKDIEVLDEHVLYHLGVSYHQLRLIEDEVPDELLASRGIVELVKEVRRRFAHQQALREVAEKGPGWNFPYVATLPVGEVPRHVDIGGDKHDEQQEQTVRVEK